jgi:hypothetical protein
MAGHRLDPPDVLPKNVDKDRMAREVSKLEITLPERHTPRAVPAPPEGRRTAVQEREPQQQVAAQREPERCDVHLDARFTARLDGESRRGRGHAPKRDHASLTAGHPPVLAGVIGEAMPSDRRPMELGAADAPVLAETNGARRSFGEARCRTPLSTFSTCFSTCRKQKPSNFEPLPGFEPGTYGLRNRCSTPELQRPVRR